MRIVWIFLIGSLFLLTRISSGQSAAFAPANEDSVIFDLAALEQRSPFVNYVPVSILGLRQPEAQDQSQSKWMSPSLPQAQFADRNARLALIAELDAAEPLLIGKISVRLSATLSLTPDTLDMTVQAWRNDAWQTVAVGTFDHNGARDLVFGGVYTQRLKIEIPHLADAMEAIASVQVYQILLSTATRIMLMGDSITDGKLASEDQGYRHVLYRSLKSAAHNIDFVGYSGDAPYEGHFQGGMKISDFYPRNLPLGEKGRMDPTSVMNSFRPQIVTVHLGTNDLSSESGAPIVPYSQNGQFAYTQSGQMAELINYLLKWHNGENGTELEYLLISLIIPMSSTSMDSDVVYFNLEVSRLVNDFRTGVITGNPEPVFMCDHFSAFKESDFKLMADKLHPNESGHAVMADVFYQKMNEFLSGNKNWFSNITFESGTVGFDHHYGGQGIAIADIDQDGRDDLYVSRTASATPFRREAFYHNTVTGPLRERATLSNIADIGDSRGMVWVDIDNDSDLDLFNGNSPGQNKLYENLSALNYRDISSEAGIANQSNLTTAVLAFDADNDGDMDLLAVNSRVKNEFYINNGLGRFQLENRGLEDIDEPDIPTLAAATADFDQDGDVDVYLVKRDAPNKLMINNGAGYFQDMALQAGVALTHRSNSAVWADLDNDADLDLLVAVSAISVDPNPMLRVFENIGQGRFNERTPSITIPLDGYSVIAADFDNDGDTDLITLPESQSGAYYRNDGRWRFTRLNNTGAEVRGADPRSAAVWDFDNDGDVDFYVTRSDLFNLLLQNNLPGDQHYLKINAQGPQKNAKGYGTKIWLYETGRLGDVDALIAFREISSSGGHLAQSSPTQHFGLAGRTSCDVLARFTDQTFLVLRNVPANQTIDIRPEMPLYSSSNPTMIEYVSGNGQSGVVGSALPEPIQVKVSDEKKMPAPNATVVFEVVRGEAELTVPESVDSAHWIEAENGRLSGDLVWAYDAGSSGNGLVLLPPGATLGRDTLLIELAQSGTFHLWARVSNNNAGATLSCRINESLVQSFSLPVNPPAFYWSSTTDQNGVISSVNLSAGLHRLVLEVSGVGLQIDKLLLTDDLGYVPVGLGEESFNQSHLTDREGIARRYVQFKQKSGPVKIEAMLEKSGTIPVSFDLTAYPGAPAMFYKVSGDGQVGEKFVELPEPLGTHISDALGNPIAGQEVVFNILNGAGSLRPGNRMISDSSGTVKVFYSPGDQGSAQKIEAKLIGGLLTPLYFNVSIRGVAQEIRLVSGDHQQGVVGAELAKPVIVTVTEESGAPAVAYPVKFWVNDNGCLAATSESDPTSGTVSQDSMLLVTTDAVGQVLVHWRLGTSSGFQTLNIEAPGLVGSPLRVSAQAVASKPGLILKISGDHQSAEVAQSLAEAFRVRVSDAYGNAIPAFPVQFVADGEGGSFDGATQKTVLTDSAGMAAARLTLGIVAGENLYRAKVYVALDGDTLTGAPVFFSASALAAMAARLEKVSGDHQRAVVTHAFPEPLVLRVTDVYGNPIPEKAVDYEISAAGGLINRSDRGILQSNSDGFVRATMFLGVRSGVHQVKFSSANLTPAAIWFSMQALPDEPFEIHYYSGSGQTGHISGQLSQPLQVKITDQFENGVLNHPVLFTVQNNFGTLSDQPMKTVLTDTLGIASAWFTLSDQLGDSNHVVTATSSYLQNQLQGSPIIFYASAVTGIPARLIPLTGGYGLLGALGKKLPDPISVRIVDANLHVISGFPVTFRIVSGGGTLSNSAMEHVVLTDVAGIAATEWRLGHESPEQHLEVLARFNESHLVNSPYPVSALAITTKAKAIVLKSPSELFGQVGDELPEPVVVQVMDDLSLPVEDHPVEFRVAKGDGTFSGEMPSVIVKTDAHGVASARYTVGKTVGHSSQQLEIVSYQSSAAPLQGAPISVVIRALPGPFDPDSSYVRTTTPIPANGKSASNVTVVVRDRYGNPIPDQLVRWLSTGISASVVPPTGWSDSTGTVSALVSSRVPGWLTLRAKNETSGQEISGETSIEFLDSRATVMHAGKMDSAIGYPSSFLATELRVRVLDDLGNPVAGFPVTFFSDGNRARVVTPQPVSSDESGYSRCRVLLGANLGNALVLARAPGLENDPIQFPIEIRQPTQVMLHRLSDSTFSGTVATRSLMPLLVQLTDRSMRPIANLKTAFLTTDQGIVQADSQWVRSNADGIAATTFSFGSKAGFAIVRAQLEDVSPDSEFRIRSLPAAPEKLLAVRGDFQRMQVMQRLSEPLVVRLTDGYLNPISEQQILFFQKETRGFFESPVLTTTDSAGHASVNFRLAHQSGAFEIIAQMKEIPSIQRAFRITALPGEVRAMTLKSGNQQSGISGHFLNHPLIVRVLDQYENGVPKEWITFNDAAGHEKIVPAHRIQSDSSGFVTAFWKLSPGAGTKYIAVRHEKLTAPLIFSAQASANHPPKIHLPDSLEIKEGDKLSFVVQTSDAEADSVTLLALQFPVGATFLAEERQVNWQPSFDQAGSHVMIFQADDHAGAISQHVLRIRVINVNRAPIVITEQTYPLQRILGAVKKPVHIDFSVMATDPDGDLLRYLWLVNDVAAAAAANFRLQTRNIELGPVNVRVLVFDAQDTVQIGWSLEIITRVELDFFNAHAKPFEGVRLHWKTHREIDNRGFRLSRSSASEGVFLPISEMIPTKATGDYEFHDPFATCLEQLFYHLECVQNDGTIQRIGNLQVTPVVPQHLAVFPGYPNPFNHATKIRWQTPEAGDIELVIYDVLGREVRRLAQGWFKAGFYEFTWDGTDQMGAAAASGTFLVTLRSKDVRMSQKLILLK